MRFHVQGERYLSCLVSIRSLDCMETYAAGSEPTPPDTDTSAKRAQRRSAKIRDPVVTHRSIATLQGRPGDVAATRNFLSKTFANETWISWIRIKCSDQWTKMTEKGFKLLQTILSLPPQGLLLFFGCSGTMAVIR